MTDVVTHRHDASSGAAMSLENGAREFTRTHWTLVGLAKHGNAAEQSHARQELAEIYIAPLYHFYRRRKHQEADASDLASGFVVDRILTGSLLDRADATKGSLRTLIRTAARNYQIDGHRSDAARSRAEKQYLELCHAEEPYYMDDDSPAETALNQQLAIQLLERSIDRVARAMCQNGAAREWHAFERRQLDPLRGNVAAISQKGLAEELGFKTPRDLTDSDKRCRQKLAAEFRAAVRDTLGEADDLDEEFASILKILRGTVK